MDWAGRRRCHTDKRSYRSEAITPANAAWLLEGAEGITCYGAGTAAFAFLQRGTVEAVTAQSADAAYRGELTAGARAQMLLRAGYVEDYGENAAVRRPLRDYVTVIR